MKKWWLFEKQEEPDRTDYSALQAVIFTLIVIVICVAIRAVTWPGDKHVDISFIGQAVFIPMLCALGLFFFSDDIRQCGETLHGKPVGNSKVPGERAQNLCQQLTDSCRLGASYPS